MRIHAFAIATLMLLSVGSDAAPSSDSSSITLPGTGIRVVPPKGMSLAPAGSTLIDDSGKISISFLPSDDATSMEKSAVWSWIEKDPPEQVVVYNLPGLHLYRRLRSRDGGLWDGWWCCSFPAMARSSRSWRATWARRPYSGRRSVAQKSLLDDLLGQELPDPELSIGAKANPKGLASFRWRLLAERVYSKSGKFGDTHPSLIIAPIPLPPAKADALFPALCEKSLPAVFRGQQVTPSPPREANGLRYCEAMTDKPGGEVVFAALVLLPNHGVLTVMGSAGPEGASNDIAVFQAAIRNIQPLPRTQGSR